MQGLMPECIHEWCTTSLLPCLHAIKYSCMLQFVHPAIKPEQQADAPLQAASLAPVPCIHASCHQDLSLFWCLLWDATCL